MGRPKYLRVGLETDTTLIMGEYQGIFDRPAIMCNSPWHRMSWQSQFVKAAREGSLKKLVKSNTNREIRRTCSPSNPELLSQGEKRNVVSWLGTINTFTPGGYKLRRAVRGVCIVSWNRVPGSLMIDGHINIDVRFRLSCCSLLAGDGMKCRASFEIHRQRQPSTTNREPGTVRSKTCKSCRGNAWDGFQILVCGIRSKT